MNRKDILGPIKLSPSLFLTNPVFVLSIILKSFFQQSAILAMQVKDGALWKGDEKVTKAPADKKEKEDMEAFLKDYFAKSLTEQLKMKVEKLSFQPSKYSSLFKGRNQQESQYWLWAKTPSDEDVSETDPVDDGRHLVILTANRGSSPGLWKTEGALVNVPMASCAVSSFIRLAQTKSLDYDSVALLCTGDIEDYETQGI